MHKISDRKSMIGSAKRNFETTMNCHDDRPHGSNRMAENLASCKDISLRVVGDCIKLVRMRWIFSGNAGEVVFFGLFIGKD